MVKLQQYIIISLVISLLIINFSCKKEEDPPEVTNKIEIGTTTIDSISYYTSTISTILISTGGNQITQHGHCWSIDKEPTLEDKSTNLGSIDKPGKFTSELDSLIPGEKYYVKFYITYSLGTVYGDEKEFSTLNTGKPVVITSEVQNITFYTAECGGVVVSDSGLVVTARGVCWNTNGIPTLENCIAFTVDSSGIGTYTSHAPNLQESTNYFISAYATNEKGISYGEVKSFITIPIEIPEVITAVIMNITSNTAECGGNVTSAGNGTVTARGVCWSTSVNPTINDPYTTNGSGTGSFASQLTGLTPKMIYYVRAYATNEAETAYGNQVSFTTLTDILPSVITTEATNITQNSATSGGNVTSSGGGTVSARGTCWSTSVNPTIDDSHTINGSGTGSFISELTDLTPNTIYYVRTYAINEGGMAYGNQVSFETLTDLLPSVTTATVSNITQNSATSGGNVTNNGGGIVNVRGVCWSTFQYPTIDDSHTMNGSGTGSFISQLTDLTPNTTYYVRAYATNEAGTAYGNQIDCITDFEDCGEVSYEGETYTTVVIGSQCWLRKNLNVGNRINGSHNQENNSTIEKYCYDDQESYCDDYGGLYQWDEAMQYVTNEGIQGICPDGWHIPTDGEWDELVNILGGEGVAGGKMKEAGYEHWYLPNTGATNSSGFTALPNGYRHSFGGSFNYLTYNGSTWSSSEYNGTNAWFQQLRYDKDDVEGFDDYKTEGYSVRCLQD